MDLAPRDQLSRLITGYWVSQAIYAAARLGVADELRHGPRPVESLASAVGAAPEPLFRLLRALASLGLFAETEPRVFALTPLAEPLRSDVPDSARPLALMSGDEQFRAWGEIVYSVQTGRPAFDRVFGQPVFDYLAEHPESAQVFDAAMTAIHGRESRAMLDAYDFSEFQSVIDVGGGNGTTLVAVLRQHPRLQGVLFDLPHVADRTRASIESAGLAARCRIVGGNFFETVPAAGDACLLRHILHDWTDEQALTILRSCHRALPPGGKLLVVESVIPPGNEPFGGKLLDLVMLLIPGGRERTAAEYRALFDEAGFDLIRIVATAAEVSVLEGVRR